MKSEQGNSFSLEKINLAELERRTGVSRSKLRRLKANGFVFKSHALEGRKARRTILTGHTAILDPIRRNSSRTIRKSSVLGVPDDRAPGTFSQIPNRGRICLTDLPRCISASVISLITLICSMLNTHSAPSVSSST